jgi:hypothetical protein
MVDVQRLLFDDVSSERRRGLARSTQSEADENFSIVIRQALGPVERIIRRSDRIAIFIFALSITKVSFI